jgi:hypothetical protein
MKKVIVFVLLLVVSVSASAETCRVVKKTRAKGATSARFYCARDEHLGSVLPCQDANNGVGYFQELITDRSFRCTAFTDEMLTDGYICSEDDQKDTSCLPAISVSYLCCK